MNESFSDRHGFRGPDAEITVREDAPENLRLAVVQLAHNTGRSWDWVREVVCAELLKMPDSNNWSEKNIRNEVLRYIIECEWYKVYDVAERILRQLNPDIESEQRYLTDLNRFFREEGIGWTLESYKGIVFRGNEGFTAVTAKAVELLVQSNRATAASEIREALADLSRRPAPDRTGAIQHAIAALEATARHISGQPNLTLGQLVDKLGLPKPLDQGVEKLWAFGSQYGRHLNEGRMPRDDEAELVVAIACAVCVFLVGRATD